MELIPVFKIGLWNAWILTTILFLFIMLSGALPKDINKRITPAKEVKKVNNIIMIIFFILIMYSIFLPLKLGIVWFYAGLAVYILGFIVSIAALFSIAATKPGEPFSTGMYRYSRHPMFLAAFIVALGVSMASASWLYLLLSIIGVFLRFRAYIIPEERFCLEKYGDTYQEYLNITPRWIGIPKS